MTKRQIPIGKRNHEAQDLESPLLGLQELDESGPLVIDDRMPLQLAMTGWQPVEHDHPTDRLVGQPIQWLDGGQALLTNQLMVRLAPGVEPKRLSDDASLNLSYVSRLPMTDRTYLIRVPAAPFDPVTALYQLLDQPYVEWAEPDLLAFLESEFFLKEFAGPTDSGSSQPWQWDSDGLNVRKIWSKQEGQGVTVAVIDLGFQADHFAFGNRITSKYRIGADGKLRTNFWTRPPWVHGTFCAGLVAADSADTRGVAPGANLVLIGIDHLTKSSLTAALKLCGKEQVDIVSCSLASCSTAGAGYTGCRSSWKELGEVLESSLVVAKNSSSSHETPIFWSTTNHDGAIAGHPLAATDHTIAVGGHTKSGEKWPGETGRKLTYLGPATSIGSTQPVDDEGMDRGSSWAAPAAAGLAALLRAQGPNLTTARIQEAMEDTCRSIDGKGGGGIRDNSVGYGALDGVGAWEELGFPTL